MTDKPSPREMRGWREYPKMNDEQAKRFMGRVMPEPNTGCWLWLGSLGVGDYGRFRLGGQGAPWFKAHRLAYVYFVGPLDRSMTVDHVKARGCGNRFCVNPDHLEAVTNRENVLRGDGPTAQNKRRLVCQRGHNAWYVSRLGHRECRECIRAKDRRRKARKSGPR